MSLVFALLLDALVGEPRAIWNRIPHPAVLMGRCVSALDTGLNAGPARKLKGVIALAVLVAIGVALGLLIQSAGRYAVVLEVVVAGVLLAQRSLVEHVRAVAEALGANLESGRAMVSRIVGRDPATLDEPGVARAALESLAENFSDGVVAPAFWFAVAGAPGIIAYKMVNTADSMIGNRSERHAEFGWATARFDDLINLVPARLCGLLYCLTGYSFKAFRVMLRDAPGHNSPNAGWPEAALASVLGVALAGPRVYDGQVADAPYMNAEGRRETTAGDIEAGLKLTWKAWGWVLSLTIVLALLEVI